MKLFLMNSHNIEPDREVCSRYLPVARQYLFYPFLGADANSIAKAWNAKSWNWINWMSQFNCQGLECQVLELNWTGVGNRPILGILDITL